MMADSRHKHVYDELNRNEKKGAFVFEKKKIES
jgi:hypothetical protein